MHNGLFNGCYFDRQKIIGNYIVDFYCASWGVVIEIDGGSHHDKLEYDAKRDEFLNSLNLVVIHILAQDILDDLDGVMSMLRDHPALRAPLTTPPYGHPSGEGNRGVGE